MSATLSDLLQKQPIWRGGHSAKPAHAVATGHAPLDRLLGGGWPQGALTELLSKHSGIGEMRILLPALANISRNRWVVLVNPPYVPYAPALANHGLNLKQLLVVRPGTQDRLWATEQCLRSAACGAVLSWFDDLDFRRSRRLQLAAEAGQSCGFVFRQRDSSEATAAALRLSLNGSNSALQLAVLKQRGALGREQLAVGMH